MKKATLKTTILGTEDYHTTMREIADSSLRRMMSYVPQRMEPDNPVLPVHSQYLGEVDWRMQRLADDRRLTNCNPRSPYLLLAWLLVGSDNMYHLCQYIDDVYFPQIVAITHIRIALGDTPLPSEIEDAVRVAKDNYARGERDITWVVSSAIWNAAGAVKDARATPLFVTWVLTAAKSAGGGDSARSAARIAITNKARQWAHISDEEALQIIRQLTFDILSL